MAASALLRCVLFKPMRSEKLRAPGITTIVRSDTVPEACKVAERRLARTNTGR